MNIKTLSEAIALVEFLMSRQGMSLSDAIKEIALPMHLQEQLHKYFEPPLIVRSSDLIVDHSKQIPLCDPGLDSNQQYFGALRRYLIEERGRSKSVVETLATTSLDLVKRLPKPDASIQYQHRGLVVGHIQSGKTATMAALIARAADEGYKLFIIFGGAWKDLRAQTQRRLDQEITGESENLDDGPLVIHEGDISKWSRLTQAGLEGDFTPGTTSDFNPQRPQLAVIKKNKRIETLTEWLKKTGSSLKDMPALIIDDECDQSSINTNYGKYDDDGEELDPSATNRRIRELLSSLPKCVYIGFTATPFANVLIDSSVEEDLYPRDFIATLPEPPGYFGPRKLFGLGMDASMLSPDEEEEPSLNVLRNITETDAADIDVALATGGESRPEVLSDAILSFVLSCCGRLARGHGKEHFSMLIHPSHRTDPHAIFRSAVENDLALIREAALRPSRFPMVMDKAKKEWERFLNVTRSQGDPNLIEHSFDTIWRFSKEVLDSLEIKVLNRHSNDQLEYTGRAKRYIVIGGNKLSRGLTLEGLSVSLFARDTNTYDTLLQMGRWFGYRPGYYDLTQIFVSKEMEESFADLARIEDDLRSDLKKYSQLVAPPSPLELKPKIRKHPTMAVTSRFKMGAGRPTSISFENTIQQTVSFPIDEKMKLRKNLNAAAALIASIGKPDTSVGAEGMHVWHDRPVSNVLAFLKEYEFSLNASVVNRDNITGYISRLSEMGELLNWDIVIPSGSKKEDIHVWPNGIFSRKIVRRPATNKSIRILSSPSDRRQWIDLAGKGAFDATRGCLMLYVIDKTSGIDKGKNFFKLESEAEDLLGLVLIFPESSSHETIEYISQ